MIYNKPILQVSILILLLSNLVLGQKELHVSSIEEVRFSSNQFKIVGNLYIPVKDGKSGRVEKPEEKEKEDKSEEEKVR